MSILLLDWRYTSPQMRRGTLASAFGGERGVIPVFFMSLEFVDGRSKFGGATGARAHICRQGHLPSLWTTSS